MEHEQQQKRNGTNYAYVIFVTPEGKGYGCFSIDQIDDMSFKVGHAFCHPKDRSRFQKDKGRKISKGRMEASDKVYVFDTKTVSNSKIVDEYMKQNIDSMPSWATKAFIRKAYEFRLTNDFMSFDAFVQKLDLGSHFFKEMKASRDNLFY